MSTLLLTYLLLIHSPSCQQFLAQIVFGGLPLAFTLLSQVKATMATRFATCHGNGLSCPHVGQRSRNHGLRWGACSRCEWDSNEEPTNKWMASSRISVCLLCWLETKRVSRGDVCLCKGTIMMLARMRLSQLCLGHREDLSLIHI